MSTVFNSEIYPIFKRELSKPNKNAIIMNHIKKFVDRNSECLFHNFPSHRLFMRDEDRVVIADTVGITEVQVTNAIKKCKLVAEHWVILNKPFIWDMLMLIKYYTEAKKNKELESAIIFLSLSYYSTLQYKYFRVPPNEEIAKYTINNLSNKYKIKQLGTMFAAVHDTAMNSHATYESLIRHSTDEELLNYAINLWTRLNSLIQNIKREYEDNRAKGNYLNTERESKEEENYHEADSISFAINRIADKFLNAVMTGGINETALKAAADSSEIATNTLRLAIQKIVNKQGSQVREIGLRIAQLYIVDGKNDTDNMGDRKFITYCLNTYNKSNTNDESVLKIKEILDGWLKESSEFYLKTNREATKGSFRRALFVYFVLVMTQI